MTLTPARRRTAPTEDPLALRLGLPGFSFADLFAPARLADLFRTFVDELDRSDPSVALRYREILDRGEPTREDESWVAVTVGPFVTRFIVRLFGVEAEAEALRDRTRELDLLLRVRRSFTKTRVFVKGRPEPAADDAAGSLGPVVDRIARVLGEPRPGEGPEMPLARAIEALLALEKALDPATPGGAAAPLPPGTAARLGRIDVADPPAPGDLGRVRAALDAIARWAAFAHAHDPARLRGFTIFRLQEPMQFHDLVERERPRPDLPELSIGPSWRLRRRTGFDLTDSRMASGEVRGEVDTCIFCHERSKDSCATGLRGGDGTPRRNPLGIPLAGCPLEEHISEAHWLRDRGDALAALAAIMINNPMLPGTGHRICNDCMKSCIYQKQEPVNIPEIETGILTDVLAFPYGAEIYGLLTRWNPLNVRRPFQLPLNGRKVLVVGLGPAGYTLAQHLTNEGFGVVAVDGLKIEPLPDGLAGPAFGPIRDWKRHTVRLSERIAAGFGGVSEYGITVRWDKNFLHLIHVTLARRRGFAIHGGVRFGGTLLLEDAAELGFDHVAVATGAGRPTVVPMRNNLIRGVRKASDFLMALQLTGAWRESSLANLQVALPAVVIGGGLTAIDTATELFAYYPVEVERVAARVDALRRSGAYETFEARLSAEERETLGLFLEHAALFRSERARAEAALEAPDFVPIVRSLGGVTVAYRKSLSEAPAYRLNHEEVVKAFEEGVAFAENLAPVECVPDSRGAVRAVRFERQALTGGKWRGTGEIVELPARTVMVAAGTSPNTMYERERPGTFRMRPDGAFFEVHGAAFHDGEVSLRPAPAEDAFFTSWTKGGLTVSVLGDNHPAYAGNVVKAMASARRAHLRIVEFFASGTRNPDPATQPIRDRSFEELERRLQDELGARVVRVERLTPTITEVVLRAPFQARKFRPGQFYRLQNFDADAPVVEGIRLSMEGLALTGAWVDPEAGLLSLIILEMGGSSNLCAALRPGQQVVCMGPTGAPTEIPRGETVCLAGGGLGNAVLFSIARALRDNGCRVLYFAGYKNGADLFKQDEIEAATDVLVYATDAGAEIRPRRPGDRHVRANIVQAMIRYGRGELGPVPIPLDAVDRIIAIGSDRMMAAVKAARHDPALLASLLRGHVAVGSINSPMQCMMKEICAQCLQRHVDPATGKETFVFSCFNQDQELDRVDFDHLNQRLRQNSLLEKITAATLARLLPAADLPRV